MIRDSFKELENVIIEDIDTQSFDVSKVIYVGENNRKLLNFSYKCPCK